MAAYYNEIDPKAAAWLRELIKQGQIAPGEVDERSIEDVTPNDLRGYTQCHFFAGIGVWSYALRQSGWTDDRPVWTGSCPCQPFSAAGKGKGFDDERHLWPAFHWLIEQCRPVQVFGEQVAGKAGETWLDLVSTDLENSSYTVGAAVTAACGFGAPHMRKRLYWVADNTCERLDRSEDTTGKGGRDSAKDCGSPRRMADSERHSDRSETKAPYIGEPEADGPTDRAGGYSSSFGAAYNPDPTNGLWRDADWLFCRDGKWRAVEPGTFPLAHGVANRVVKLRGFGNAIVSSQAKAFIESYMDI